ncbi:hypothetical protein [Alteromonas gilva]|uniref:Uncharacterized protein n=1 Tax=Alteromonas gilva TaxID=2987522 RepID=A0ABT5L2T3_9ALTE|nr:hypothetical protein [Alteromonas gilva]MDC8831346.1 hypothetical protein [Alteromonas gilva]
MKRIFLFLVFLCFGFQNTALSLAAERQPTIAELEEAVIALQYKVQRLEYNQSNNHSYILKLQESVKNNGLGILLFAFFCAWWAKITGRNAVLWFFLGLFFHIFTAIALIVKTERYR